MHLSFSDSAKKITPFLISLPFFSFSFSSYGQNTFSLPIPSTEMIILDNGMRCLFQQQKGTGLVSLNLRVLTGSASEDKYLGTGISHLVEHMGFKSTKSFPPGEIEREIKSLGGIMNASTSYDTTAFYITVPSQHLARAFDILTEVVFEANFPTKELADEKKVILKEMILHEDNPSSKLHNLLWRTAYHTHPYQYPIIGYRELFNSLTRENVLDYYKSNFIPNNMVLAVVGDTTWETTQNLIRTHFAPYPRKALFKKPLSQEPFQLFPKTAQERAEISLARIALAFPSIPLLHPDLFKLDVLAAILGQGEDSRLYKILVNEQQLVRSVECYNYTPRDQGLFVIEAILEPANIDKTVKLISKELEKLQTTPPQTAELERAKALLISNHVYSQESIAEIASALTHNEIITGNYSFDTHYFSQIQKVTAQEIVDAAATYLLSNHMISCSLLPEDASKEPFSSSSSLSQSAAENNRTISTLPNGIRIAAVENTLTPTVFITAAFHGGLRAETPSDNGISLLTSKMLLRGTEHYTAQEIKSLFEQKGGIISSFSGKNSFGITIRILNTHFNWAMEMMQELLFHSTFPEQEFIKVQQLAVWDAQISAENIFRKGITELRQILYDSHPYRLPEEATPQTLQALTKEKIKQFYKQFCVSSNLVIAIAGDISPQKAVAQSASLFSPLPLLRNESILAHQSVTPLSEEKSISTTMPKEEAIILLGMQGVQINTREYYAFEILTSILSGSSGRLFHTVRNTESISYSQNFFSAPGYDRGYCGFYIATSPENIEHAKKMILRERNSLFKQEITEEELLSAKIELRTKFRNSLQHNEYLSFQTALNVLLGGTIDTLFLYEEKIYKTTLHELKTLISRYIETQPYALVVITPAKDEND